MFDYILGKRVARPGNCNLAYSFFFDSILIYIMYGKAKYTFDNDCNLFVDPPKKPTRKPDFQKHGWRFWIEEGVVGGSYDPDKKCIEVLEHLQICQVTGMMMLLCSDEYEVGQQWNYLESDFQEAYQKWAKKQAEKALLGE
jgi:hypothetical protein